MNSVTPLPAFTVLIVEDNPLAISLYQTTLAALSEVRTVVAGDGFAGLLQTCEHNPDIIITDLDMPNFDGHQLLRILQADPLYRATHLIVISGLTEAEIEHRGGLPHCASFIRKKDFSATGLRQLVAAQVGKWQQARDNVGAC
jgi:CheY-like chemotaxis protein